MKPNIEIHIEELLLHGFSPGDRYRIGDAVEHEIAELVRQNGLGAFLTRDGEVGRIDAGTFSMTQDQQQESTGRQIAQSLWKGINTLPQRGKQ